MVGDGGATWRELKEVGVMFWSRLAVLQVAPQPQLPMTYDKEVDGSNGKY